MSDEPTKVNSTKTVILKRDLPAPSFSHLTDPTWVSPEEKRRTHAARSGGGYLGGGLGAAGGALLGKHLAGGRGAAVGGVLGGLLGYGAGKDLATAHNDHLTVKRDQAVADRERAQEHRKELLDVKDTIKKKEASSLHGVMFSAMAHELASMDQEKVAINLAPLTGAISGLASQAASAAPRVMGALEGVGARALTGVTNLAGRASPGVGQAVSGGLMRAGQAVGGGQNLSRIAGGALAGGAALGTLGAAKRVLAPSPRPVQIQMR